jgi:alkanesulfonate monooxygenase SsuD/methylene tetrahydromethanopterin reductase-like flavin-dependent oxidoreductase (luciferase family)
MTMAAAATKKLKVATGICLVIQRDPIVLAKEVASLDLASNGRMIFGIGGGWNAEEMEDHGTAFKSRWKLLRERIEAMKALWTSAGPISR